MLVFTFKRKNKFKNEFNGKAFNSFLDEFKPIFDPKK